VEYECSCQCQFSVVSEKTPPFAKVPMTRTWSGVLLSNVSPVSMRVISGNCVVTTADSSLGAPTAWKSISMKWPP
jgi:alpha-D-ribose 1-methylphosphonate 5-triphosphate synthase subunit PhnL